MTNAVRNVGTSLLPGDLVITSDNLQNSMVAIYDLPDSTGSWGDVWKFVQAGKICMIVDVVPETGREFYEVVVDGARGYLYYSNMRRLDARLS